jgi:hypothetical protein
VHDKLIDVKKFNELQTEHINSLKKLKLKNGGSIKLTNGITVKSKNTCSIDYFLIIIYLLYPKYKWFKSEWLNVFKNIFEFVLEENWDLARIEWSQYAFAFQQDQFPPKIENLWDWKGSEYESFSQVLNSYQEFSWSSTCENQRCKNNKTHTSSSFNLR